MENATFAVFMTIAGSAAFIGGVFQVIMWKLNRRAALKDKRQDMEDERSTESKTFVRAIRLIMHDRLKFVMETHIAAGWISVDDLKNLKDMYECYRDLGGNGLLEHLYDQVKKMPLKTKNVQADSEKPALHELKHKPQILAVDDSTTTLQSITIALKADYHVQTLLNPLEVQAVLFQNRPSLFILDYLMPDLSGLDVIKIIRGFAEHRHTPIIMLTGDDASGTLEKALEHGVAEFITKPFKLNELKNTVDKILKG